VAGCYEEGNEHSGYIKYGTFVTIQRCDMSWRRTLLHWGRCLNGRVLRGCDSMQFYG